MFIFDENTYSHMPFVAHGPAPEFAPKQFCCLMVSGKWKIHQHEDGVWKRINTDLQEDATECSPTAEYDPINEKWRLSYIAGGHEADRSFKLYFIEDLENPEPEALIHADVGFVFKNRLVHATRNGPIIVSDGMGDKALKILDAEYLYRVSYNPNNPNELLVSGQDLQGEIFSRILDPYSRKLYELRVDGKMAYKAALFNGECFYADRGESDGFEDRHIVKAKAFSRVEIPYDKVLEFDI